MKGFENHRPKLVCVGNKKAEIDNGIDDLIEEMWKAGIDTFMSCQGYNKNKIWISFLEHIDLEMFLNIVFPDFYSSAKLVLSRAMSLGPKKSGKWIYETAPRRLMKDGDLHLLFKMYFPKQDYAYVLQKMRQFNKTN